SVVPEMREERVPEHRLAVGAGAVEEEQGELLGGPGQAIACEALQVLCILSVALGDLLYEIQPEWTAPLGRRGGDFGHPVGTVVRAHPPGAQIHYTTWGVEQPDVGIPLV